MKFISFKDSNFKYTGVWQDNIEEEIVSYGAVAFAEIGFSGSVLEVIGRIFKNATFIIDGGETKPTKTRNGFKFSLNGGNHTLKIRMVERAHFHLKGIKIEADAEVFTTENKPYIHYIGDSISFAYPGFSASSAEKLGLDYSVVAQCGMSLVDGWGWYKMHPDAISRRGMESTYFGLEDGQESATLTPYKFEYLRKPDIIVIFLGTNDYLDMPNDEYRGNIDIFAKHYLAFVKKIRNIFKDVPIFMLQALTDSHCRRRAIKVAYDLINSELDNVTLLSSDEWGVEISKDGTHPSPDGYAHMGECLAKVLKEKIKKS
ncbi:MAG: SGNH/GDSL hydrolase family protein [Clostridia bacterium]|nr:SGNH/GDSL hydrolase family protein [Clostridia bacterium]